jgi:hypothetical protein
MRLPTKKACRKKSFPFLLDRKPGEGLPQETQVQRHRHCRNPQYKQGSQIGKTFSWLLLPDVKQWKLYFPKDGSFAVKGMGIQLHSIKIRQNIIVEKGSKKGSGIVNSFLMG